MSVVETSDETASGNESGSRINQFKSLGKPVVVGLLVALIGIWVPLLLLVILPGFGGVVAWVVFVVIFVLYTSGRLLDRPTRAWRQERFRAITIDREQLGSAILLALLFVMIGQSLLMVTFRLMPYPREQFLAGTNYDDLSLAMVWVVVLISALGAGIYEEIGFRGYMQQPMEKSHGFLLANTVTSFVFMLMHLNQAWAPFVLPWLFMLSFLLGIIAYCTRSLVPGIIAHTLMDIFNFGYWWSDAFGSFQYNTIWSGGIDGHFVVWAVFLILSTVGFFLIARYLHTSMNKSDRVQS